MKTTILPIILAAVVLTGCMSFTGNKSVPSNRFKDKEREIVLAQDSHAKDVLIQKQFVDKDGFTNSVTINIKGLEGKNNPDVVNAAGAANVNSILAGGQVFQQGFQAGTQLVTQLAALLGQSQGLPVKAPSGPPASTGIPGKESLKIGDVVYTLIGDPDSHGGWIYESKGKKFLYSENKMIPLPE